MFGFLDRLVDNEQAARVAENEFYRSTWWAYKWLKRYARRPEKPGNLEVNLHTFFCSGITSRTHGDKQTV